MRNPVRPAHLLNRLVLLAVTFCCYRSTHAQLPDFRWKFILDGYHDVWLADLVVDNKGSTYVGVNYMSRLTVPGLEQQKLPFAGHVHGLIVKLDASGKALWAHPFKSNYDNRINDLALAPNGDLLVTGFGDGQMHFPGHKDTLKLGKPAKDIHGYLHRYQGFYAARYAPDGDRKWAQYFDAGWGEGMSIGVNSKNEVYLGYYHAGALKQGDVAIDSVPVQGANRYRFGMAKLDGKSGKLLSFRKLADQPDNGVALTARIRFDAADNMILFGYFRKRIFLTATDSLTNDGYYEGTDGYIAKLDPKGKLLWSKRLGGQSTQIVQDVVVAGDSSIYATGMYSYECVLGDGVQVVQKSKYEYKSGYSFFYLHLFNDGETDFVRYEQSRGYSSYMLGDNIAVDARGNAYITGYFTDTLHIDGIQATTASANRGYTGYYSKWSGSELKYLTPVGDAPKGSLFAWQIDLNKQFYAFGGDYYGDSATLNTSKGNVLLSNKDYGKCTYIIGGIVNNTADSLPIATTSNTREDRIELVKAITGCKDTTALPNVWLPLDTARVQSACGDIVKGKEVVVFPNPTRGEVKLRFTGIVGMVHIEIFSEKGQLVLSHRLDDVFEGQVVNFDLSAVADGVYVVRVKHKDLQKGVRVIKLR
jgi:hypothetical protein